MDEDIDFSSSAEGPPGVQNVHGDNVVNIRNSSKTSMDRKADIALKIIVAYWEMDGEPGESGDTLIDLSYNILENYLREE